MFGLGIAGPEIVALKWQGTLSDYVTTIAWSPDGKTLAASSSAGDVVLWQGVETVTSLQTGAGESIDCLAFSSDGQLLAAAGQDGTVKIWRVSDQSPLYCLENAPAWVDRLAWSSIGNQLAFSTGRFVQIWDAGKGEIIAKLNFEASSALDLAWHPAGEYLAIAGYQGVKIWNTQNWEDDPYSLVIPSATAVVKWSPDGKYLAGGNLDKTLTVLEWGNPHPWVMRGFPGKVRQLAWSDQATELGAPLLAAASAGTISVWEKQLEATAGWEAWGLELHEGVVGTLSFQPASFLLASASEDGHVCLWQQAEQLAQILEGAPTGFSCLAWDSQGHQLAAGGQEGQLLIWSKSQHEKAFG